MSYVETWVGNFKWFLEHFDGKTAGFKSGMITDMCEEPAGCIVDCCCPCIAQKQITTYVTGTPGWCECVFVWCQCTPCNVLGFQMKERAHIRAQAGISHPEPNLSDALASGCLCLSFHQLKKEMNKLGKPAAPAQESMA